MDNVPSPIENENSDYGAAKISADLRRLERRDLWAWMNAVVIILGLTGAVFSLSASLQWMGMKTVLGVDYRVAARALVILVLAFTAHTIYQQVKLRKLRRELKEQHVQGRSIPPAGDVRSAYRFVQPQICGAAVEGRDRAV
jgi:hypothetical protein